MAPPAKRKRRAGAGAGGASSAAGRRRSPSAAECTKMAGRLSTESAQALLAKLMATSHEALDAVKAEIAERDAEPVDLRHYAAETSEIMYSLDGLRDSQKYMRAGELLDRLTTLVEECRRELSVTQAFEAIATIMEGVESAAEGEIRNAVLGCGGIDGYIAKQLAALVAEMSAEQKASVDGAIDDLERVVERLSDEGSGYDLIDVVKNIRDN